MRRSPAISPIAVTKFAAALFTGSSAMLSEGVHSLVDTGNGCCCSTACSAPAGPPDRTHPLGPRPRALFLELHRRAPGVRARRRRVALRRRRAHHGARAGRERQVNYIVLGALVPVRRQLLVGGAEGIPPQQGQARLARRRCDRARIRASTPCCSRTAPRLLGLIVAFAGILGAQLLEMPELDGAASIGIGLVLGATADLPGAREQGPADRRTCAAGGASGRCWRSRSRTPRCSGRTASSPSISAPTRSSPALSIEFEDHLTAPQIEACVERLEARLKQPMPADHAAVRQAADHRHLGAPAPGGGRSRLTTGADSRFRARASDVRS